MRTLRRPAGVLQLPPQHSTCAATLGRGGVDGWAPGGTAGLRGGRLRDAGGDDMQSEALRGAGGSTESGSLGSVAAASDDEC